MSRRLLVVEDPGAWRDINVDGEWVAADDYLTDPAYFKLRDTQVINLCRSWDYLSTGYYCSLLAEARGQRVIPAVRTLLTLRRKSLYRLESLDLDKLVQKASRKHPDWVNQTSLDLLVLFGQCPEPAGAELARQVFEVFPHPALQVRLKHDGHWQLDSIRPQALKSLSAEAREFFSHSLTRFLARPWRNARKKRAYRYDLALLHDPNDAQPPSDARALERFVRAAEAEGVRVEMITEKDYARVAEFDGLFIRVTTNLDHYTYRFARRAEGEGLVVIDDAQSILRCTNKVYLAELLRVQQIPAPKQVIAAEEDLDQVEAQLDYPMVLKLPDGSFSQGVFKAENREQLNELAARLFKHSELILCQEFLYTDFDWRIGILDNQPLYACKYYMSKQHWQIIKYGEGGQYTEGGWDSVAIEQVPEVVLRTALAATAPIGDSLYGVDLKQRGDEVFVIEVNDNPNLEAGVEDKILKQGLWERLMRVFVERMEARRAQWPGRSATAKQR